MKLERRDEPLVQLHAPRTWSVCDADLHVEDADSTQRSACPLLLVVVQSRVHRVGKFANDRNRPSRAGQMCLFVSVNNL